MTGIIPKTSEFVTRLFEEKLPKGCVYHSINHTLEVIEAAREIGERIPIYQMMIWKYFWLQHGCMMPV